jgi:hypothetical protein
MNTNTTLYQLINDSLMPELTIFTDPRLFRRLCRFIHESYSESGNCFINPLSVMQDAGLPVLEKVEKEWLSNEKRNQLFRENPPRMQLISIYPHQHKTHFFVFLFWQSLQLDYEILAEGQMPDTANAVLKKYELMHFMTQLEQLMEDNAQKSEPENEIRKAFNLLMAFYWLKTFRKYKDVIHLKSLRFFEEEMLHLFRQVEDKDPLLLYLAKTLEDGKELISEDEERIPEPGSLLDMAERMKADIETIKTALDPLKNGISLPAERSAYIKPKEAARLLHISTSALSSWRISGRLKEFRKVANRFEYLLTEIQQKAANKIKP